MTAAILGGMLAGLGVVGFEFTGVGLKDGFDVVGATVVGCWVDGDSVVGVAVVGVIVVGLGVVGRTEDGSGVK